MMPSRNTPPNNNALEPPSEQEVQSPGVSGLSLSGVIAPPPFRSGRKQVPKPGTVTEIAGAPNPYATPEIRSRAVLQKITNSFRNDPTTIEAVPDSVEILPDYRKLPHENRPLQTDLPEPVNGYPVALKIQDATSVSSSQMSLNQCDNSVD